MNLIPFQPSPQSELFNLTDITTEKFERWRYSTPLHISSSFSRVEEDLRKNSPYKVELSKRRKLSSLKGMVTKMNADEIDKRLKSLRDEWQRDI